MSGLTAEEAEQVAQMMADLCNSRSDALSAPAADDKGRPRAINVKEEKAALRNAEAYRAANRTRDDQAIAKWNSLDDGDDPTAKADISGGQGHRYAVRGASENTFASGGPPRFPSDGAGPGRYTANTSTPHAGQGINRTAPSSRPNSDFPTRLSLTVNDTSNRPRAGSPRRHGTVRITAAGRQDLRRPSAGAQQRADNPLLNRQLATMNRQMAGSSRPTNGRPARETHPSTGTVTSATPQQPSRPEQTNVAIARITEQHPSHASQSTANHIAVTSTRSMAFDTIEDPRDANVRIFLEKVASGEIAGKKLLNNNNAEPCVEEVTVLKVRAYEDVFCVGNGHDRYFDTHPECMIVPHAIRDFLVECIIDFMQPNGNKAHERGFRLKYATKKGFAEFIAAAEMAVKFTTNIHIATGQLPHALAEFVPHFEKAFPSHKDVLAQAIKVAGLQDVAHMEQLDGTAPQVTGSFESTQSSAAATPSLTSGTTIETNLEEIEGGTTEVAPPPGHNGAVTPAHTVVTAPRRPLEIQQATPTLRAPSEPLPDTPCVTSPVPAVTHNTPAPLPAGAANPGSFTITLQQSGRYGHNTISRPFAAPGFDVNLTIRSPDEAGDIGLRRFMTEPNNLVMQMESLGLWMRGFLMRPEGPTDEADSEEEL